MPRRNEAGRPPSLESKKPVQRLYNKLPPDGSPIQKKDLKYAATRKTQGKKSMSNTTFYKYLQRLEQTGQIMREVDTSSRPPTVYYRRVIEKFLKDFYPPGRDFYQADVLGAENTFMALLMDEKDQWPMKDSGLFLVYTFWSMIEFISEVLTETSTMDTPEKARDYVEMVLKIHLLPWIQNLATAGQKTSLVDKRFMDLVLLCFHEFHLITMLKNYKEMRIRTFERAEQVIKSMCESLAVFMHEDRTKLVELLKNLGMTIEEARSCTITPEIKQKMYEHAKGLGITTDWKYKEQVFQEILEKERAKL